MRLEVTVSVIVKPNGALAPPLVRPGSVVFEMVAAAVVVGDAAEGGDASGIGR